MFSVLMELREATKSWQETLVGTPADEKRKEKNGNVCAKRGPLWLKSTRTKEPIDVERE